MRDPAISYHHPTVARRRCLPPWRARVVLVLIAAGFGALAVRAFWVQVVSQEFYVYQGRLRYERTVEAAPPRARVLDRNGNILAISEPVADLWVVPQEFVAATPQQRQRVAQALGIPLTEVVARAGSDRRFQYLKRHAPLGVAHALRAENIPGLNFTETSRRSFPAGSDIANVIGLTGIDGQGLEGIELANERQLRGSVGRRRVIVDRLGRVVEQLITFSTPQSGQDIALSIDMRIQRVAMQALNAAMERSAASAASAIVVDTRTGEILAMANLPSTDPENPASMRAAGMRNRAVTDTFEPGSTIKPLTVALALELGRVGLDTRFDTAPGALEIHGARIRDSRNFGTLDLSQVVAKSSNIGMVRIAQRLSPEEMWENFRRFGLGEKPLQDYPGVAPGRLRPAQRWKPIEQATMAYGYGLSVSLAQLAEAYAAFGNDGLRPPLTLYADAELAPAVRIMSPGVARAVLLMLEASAMPGGTARVAMMDSYRVGAKTGTARKHDGRGYAAGKYRATFAGLAPVSNPKLVVAVMIDEPARGSYYGGPAAGPVFAEIMRGALRILAIPPDRQGVGL